MSAPGMRGAYDASADAWSSGPEAVYARLAAVLVDSVAADVSGARVLDLGAGTGVASRAALRAGASTAVALDPARGMLRRVGPAVHPVQGDAARLPFRDAAFDLALAALSLGHVPDPLRALRETGRVARGLAASAFASGWTHPAKPAVDEALVPLGFRPPSWYLILKHDGESRVDEPDVFGALATEAGYTDVRVSAVEVQTGLTSPGELAAWRLGMAHLAPFIASLEPDQRAEARRLAEAAVAGAPPLVVPLLVLTAR